MPLPIQLSSVVKKKSTNKEMKGGLNKLIMGALIINISLLGAASQTWHWEFKKDSKWPF